VGAQHGAGLTCIGKPIASTGCLEAGAAQAACSQGHSELSGALGQSRSKRQVEVPPQSLVSRGLARPLISGAS
jgi:hypothetical protein